MNEEQIKICMKEDVYDEIHVLMRDIQELNNGDEIGAWLLGEWKEEEVPTLYIDEWYIPKQKVQRAEVEITPELMRDCIVTLGQNKCNKIVGHWHIHPFGKGDTHWSQPDIDNMTEFMHPDKKRQVFVFCLSSLDTLFARVEYNAVVTHKNGFKQVVQTYYDKLPIQRGFEATNDNGVKDKLKGIINNKVERVAEKWTTIPNYKYNENIYSKDYWKPINNQYNDYDDENYEDEPYEIIVDKYQHTVKVIILKGLSTIYEDEVQKDLRVPYHSKYDLGINKVYLYSFPKYNEKELKHFADQVEDIMIQVQAVDVDIFK